MRRPTRIPPCRPRTMRIWHCRERCSRKLSIDAMAMNDPHVKGEDLVGMSLIYLDLLAGCSVP